MVVVFFIGLLWTALGVAGLLGFRIGSPKLPKAYREAPWAKGYYRSNGICKLLIGVPYCLLYLVSLFYPIPVPVAALFILVPVIPSFALNLFFSRKYNKILAESAQVAKH